MSQPPPGARPPGAQLPPGAPAGSLPPGMFPPGALPPGGMRPPGVMPPGAVPPGLRPPSGMPPGAVPPAGMPMMMRPAGSAPPSPVRLPPGAMPPGALPSGAVPAGTLPPGALPPGARPLGAQPPGALPPRPSAQGAMPPGAMPPGAMPPGSMPPGAMPPGLMPPGLMPSGMTPPGAMPSGVIPPGSMPPGAMPPGAARSTGVAASAAFPGTGAPAGGPAAAVGQLPAGAVRAPPANGIFSGQPIVRPSLQAAPVRPPAPASVPLMSPLAAAATDGVADEQRSAAKRRVYPVGPDAAAAAAAAAAPPAMTAPAPAAASGASPMMYAPAAPTAGAYTQPQTASPYGAIPAAAAAGYAQPQQPQSAMPHQQQQAPPQRFSGIDHSQIPSVVYVQALDQHNHENTVYSTASRTVPPLSTTDCSIVDEGNCHPSFMRMTMYTLPCSDDVLKPMRMPMGLIVQPLAETNMEIPLVDFGPSGPMRCQRCRAYINPGVQFTHGGQRFTCNICVFSNEVPSEYFSNLDASGRRMDLVQRPELRFGTVEYVAPAEFSTRPPQPLHYLFAIDVSLHAVQSGQLALTCQALLQMLDSFPVVATPAEGGATEYVSPVRVGIMTYDRHVHFYNLSDRLARFQMLVVSDLDDIFVPLDQGLFVSVRDSRELIEALLNQLPKMFESTQCVGSALGSALEVALKALEKTGGRVIATSATIPNVGKGPLKPREDPAAMGTDKERQLYVPQDAFYKKLGIDCSAAGVAVDLFLAAQAHIDLATLGAVSSLTGGSCHYYYRFSAARHGPRLQEELRRTILRTHGYEAVLRVRTSTGLCVKEHFGNMYMKTAADVELAGIDADKAIGVLLQHDGKLDERADAAIQCALLYTTALGQRRIRVHTLCLPTSTNYPSLFRGLDVDALVNLWAKMAVQAAIAKPLTAVRQELNDAIISALAFYRERCASNNPPGQLVLPELVKLLPIIELGMIKCTAFRQGADLAIDERVDAMRFINAAPVRATTLYFYPTLIDITNLDLRPLDEDGRVYARPAPMRLSYEVIDGSRAYLLDNGQTVILWLGAAVPSTVLKSLFDVNYLENVNMDWSTLPELNNPYSKRVRALLDELRARAGSGRFAGLVIARQREPSEAKFINQLYEDKSGLGMSYVDYLKHIHGRIHSKIQK